VDLCNWVSWKELTSKPERSLSERVLVHAVAAIQAATGESPPDIYARLTKDALTFDPCDKIDDS